MLVVAGCARAPLGTQIPVPSGPRSITLTSDLSGTTAHAPTGDLVHVRLTGTQWTFDPPTGDVLVTKGPSVVSAGANCSTAVVGEGCGTTTATFHAVTPGTAVIHATRTTCGEARRCTGSEGDFTITLAVGHG